MMIRFMGLIGLALYFSISVAATPSQYYQLTLQTSTGGKITGSHSCNEGSECSFSVPSGTYVILNSIPLTGFDNAGWSGKCSGVRQGCGFHMTESTSAKASFKATVDPLADPPESEYIQSGPQRTLSVKKDGLGIVIGYLNRIYCGSRCDSSFNKGSVVSLTAKAPDGWFFKKWRGACKGDKSCTVRLNQSKNVTAVFEPIPGTGGGCGDICSCAQGLTNILGYGIVPSGCYIRR
jgi:hypothetical protein